MVNLSLVAQIWLESSQPSTSDRWDLQHFVDAKVKAYRNVLNAALLLAENNFNQALDAEVQPRSLRWYAWDRSRPRFLLP